MEEKKPETAAEETISVNGCKVILRFPHGTAPGTLDGLKSILFGQIISAEKPTKTCNKS